LFDHLAVRGPQRGGVPRRGARIPGGTADLEPGFLAARGTNGLIAAARRADTSTLVVASDARLTRAGSPQELSYGDGAAAVLLGPSNPAALASIVATRSIGSDFVDHYA